MDTTAFSGTTRSSTPDTDPHLVPSWHPTKNGTLRPEDVIAGSERVVFWRCDAGHDFKMRLVKRKMGARCQLCTSKLVDPDVNAFSVTHPEAAATWHPTRNGDFTPDDFLAGSGYMASVVRQICAHHMSERNDVPAP